MGAKRSARRTDDGSENEDPIEEEAEDEDFLEDDDEDDEILDDDEDEEGGDDDEWDDDDWDEEDEGDSETLCGFCQRPLGLHYADEAEEGLIPDSVECEQCRVYFCSEGCLEQHRDAEHAAEQGV